MSRTEHLSLRTIRLAPREEWQGPGQGIDFVFTRGGRGRWLAEHSDHPIGGGDVLVIGESVKGRLRARDEDELVFGTFWLAVEHIMPLVSWEDMYLVGRVAEILGRTRFYPAGTVLAEKCRRLLADLPAQFTLDHRALLLRVAGLIFAAELKQARQRGEGSSSARLKDQMGKVVEGLSSAEMAALSVDELAARFGCTRRHLNRLFHQYFGYSVASLKMELRLLRAICLLRDPGLKVIHVAEQCGFNHLGLFNVCFKRRFGTSPGQWRKQMEAFRGTELPAPSGATTCVIRASGLCPLGPGAEAQPAPHDRHSDQS